MRSKMCNALARVTNEVASSGMSGLCITGSLRWAGRRGLIDGMLPTITISITINWYVS